MRGLTRERVVSLCTAKTHVLFLSLPSERPTSLISGGYISEEMVQVMLKTGVK